MKALVTILLLCLLFSEARSLSETKSSDLCNERLLQQYNVNSALCSSKFVITSSTSNYALNEPIHIRVTGVAPETTFTRVHLIARDENNDEVGSWETTNQLRSDDVCGGVMQKTENEQTSMDAVWRVSTPAAGNIAIKVIIIEDDSTVYVNCYTVILIPRGFNNGSVTEGREPSPNTTTTVTIPPTNTTSSTTATTQTTTVSAVTTSTASPANTTAGPSPTADVTVNATWTFTSGINVTSVVMTIKNLKSAEWTAIGLGQEQSMGEAHVFICKRLANDTIVVHRYINPGKHKAPEAAGSEQGGDFTPGQQQFKEGLVICQFDLSDFKTQTSSLLKDLRPLSQSAQYYPLIAIGMLDEDNEPQKHAHDSRTAKADLVQLNQNEVILYRISADANDLTFVRTHGIIMIFTWILIVSTGALISRYFKVSWANRLICGKAAWFAAHRFLMSLAAVLTMLGFLFILVFLKGTWVDQSVGRPFAHSITGVIVISLAFFQPFIALFRCEPDSRYRFAFNYLHGFVGFSAFIISIATLFLATYFHLFKNGSGRTVMIVWIIWVVLVFIVFECIEYRIRKKTQGSAYSHINTSTEITGELVESPTSPKLTLTRFEDQNEAALEQKLKNIFLAIHVLVATILSVILTTLIL